MSLNSQTARKCFAENLHLFADSATRPEQYNLYQGLAALAAAIEDVERSLQTITSNQQVLHNAIKSLRQ